MIHLLWTNLCTWCKAGNFYFSCSYLINSPSFICKDILSLQNCSSHFVQILVPKTQYQYGFNYCNFIVSLDIWWTIYSSFTLLLQGYFDSVSIETLKSVFKFPYKKSSGIFIVIKSEVFLSNNWHNKSSLLVGKDGIFFYIILL